MSDNNIGFVKVFRQFFQECGGARIMDRLSYKCRTDYKGTTPDKCFSIFAILSKNKNYFGYSSITLKYLTSLFFETQSTNNIKTIKKSLEVLRDLELIECNFKLSKISSTDLIEITVHNEEYEGGTQYMSLFEEDFKLLKLLGSKFFTIYCHINNSYQREKRYSSISYSKMVSICNMSAATISSELKKAFALGIYNTPRIEYRFNEAVNKYTRMCNQYRLNRSRVKEIAKMTDEEITKIVEDTDIREAQELDRMLRFLDQGNHEVSENTINDIRMKFEELNDEVKAEVQELYNKQLEYSDDTEYRNFAYVYSYYKVRAKNIALEKGK